LHTLIFVDDSIDRLHVGLLPAVVLRLDEEAQSFKVIPFLMLDVESEVDDEQGADSRNTGAVVSEDFKTSLY
jgi:hypothetical protein